MFEQILGFSFSKTILFQKSVDYEKDVSFCEQKTEYLGLELNSPCGAIFLKMLIIYLFAPASQR